MWISVNGFANDDMRFPGVDELTLQIPILTYHSMHVDSNEYGGNDHVALREDLRAIHGAGLRVVPLDTVVRWQQGELGDAEVAGSIAITLDDGSWFDFHDLDHPSCGPQRSMFNILQDFIAEFGAAAQPQLHASSFVITSPAARTELDQKIMIGKDWWTDDWWPQAQASGLMGIECHSWDHDHPSLEQVAQRHQVKGDFRAIDSFADCKLQVGQAGEYIRARLGAGAARHFAYPWGQASDYLAQQYFPQYPSLHGFAAAYTTEARPVSRADNRWLLPRYVFERDWQSPQQFRDLLAGWVEGAPG
jgi:hypothetical protein